MKQHIFLMFTKQGTSFTQLQLRMLHLLVGEDVGLPVYGVSNEVQYFGYIPGKLIAYKDKVRAKLSTILSNTEMLNAMFDTRAAYQPPIPIDGEVDLCIIGVCNSTNLTYATAEFSVAMTQTGLLKAVNSGYGEEYPGISISVITETGENGISLVEYSSSEHVCGFDPQHPEIEKKERAEVPLQRLAEDGETVTPGIIIRAWKAYSVPDDSEMGVVRYCPYFSSEHMSEFYSDMYVPVETPMGTLVAVPFSSDAKCAGINIHLVKDGKSVLVLRTEYYADEPLQGDSPVSRYGQDVPAQRRVRVGDEETVIPGLISRYWPVLDDDDAPAHRVFHF